mgnify:CR=1 FL=1
MSQLPGARSGQPGGVGERPECAPGTPAWARTSTAVDRGVRQLDAGDQPRHLESLVRAETREVRDLEREQKRLKEDLERLMAEWEEAEEALAGVEG